MLFLLPMVVSAVVASEPVSTASPAERIVAREMQTQGAYQINAHLADRIGPRRSGSEGAATAVRWTTETLRSWGFDVRNEPVMVPHWVRGLEEAELVAPNPQKIVLTALGGSVATPPEGIIAEVVVVGLLEEVDRLGESVRGKIVLYDNPMDMDLVHAGRSFEAYGEAVQPRGRGPSRAAKYGAVAALVRSVASDSLGSPHTGMTRYDPDLPKIPAAAVTVEDAELIRRLIASGETVRMHLVLTPQTLDDVESANVVAEMRGSDWPDQVVLIGAHLDSWDLATGAIDDGAGVAGVMETFRLLHDLGLKPKRTVRLVLFMNEENGLRGARAYFAAHEDELEQHFATVESDAGATEPVGFVTSLSQDRIDALHSLFRPLEAVGTLAMISSPEVVPTPVH